VERLYSQNDIHVVNSNDYRWMISGQTVLGGIERFLFSHDQAVFIGMAIMQSVVYMQPRPYNCLCLGLGTGTVPNYLRGNGMTTDVVEISKDVIEAAGMFFDYQISSSRLGQTFHADAIQFLENIEDEYHDRYGCIIVDLFDSVNTLLSAEVISLLKSDWLVNNGVLVVNTVGYHQGDKQDVILAVIYRVSQLFSHVRVFVDQDVHEAQSYGVDEDLSSDSPPRNIILFASEREVQWDPPIKNNHIHGTAPWVRSNFMDWEVTDEVNNSLQSRTVSNSLDNLDTMDSKLEDTQNDIRDRMRKHQLDIIGSDVFEVCRS